MTRNFLNAKVFVSTFKKYNSGSLFGEWVNMFNFPTWGEFIIFCKGMHGDEKEPELMFQDCSLPSELYSESYISPVLWEIAGKVRDWDEQDIALFEAWMVRKGCEYLRNHATGADIVEAFHEQDCGDFTPPTGSIGISDALHLFAYEVYARELFGQNISAAGWEDVRDWIDLDAVARSAEANGYEEIKGHVFRLSA